MPFIRTLFVFVIVACIASFFYSSADAVVYKMHADEPPEEIMPDAKSCNHPDRQGTGVIDEMSRFGWGGDCGKGAFGKNWDFDVIHNLTPGAVAMSAQQAYRNPLFDAFETGRDDGRDMFPSRTGCYNPEERYVVDIASGSEETPFDCSQPDARCVPDDKVLNTMPECIERGRGRTRQYVDFVNPEDVDIRARASSFRNVLLCYGNDYQDDQDDFCSYYYGPQGTYPEEAYHVWHAEIRTRQEREAGDGGAQYCAKYPNACRDFNADSMGNLISDVERNVNQGAITYFHKWKPLVPIYSDDRYLPYALPNPYCGFYGVAQNEVQKPFYRVEGSALAQTTSPRNPSFNTPWEFNPTDVYFTQMHTADNGVRGVKLSYALKPENFGQKLKKEMCLKLYIEEWAFRGDCGDIVLEGARSDIGEGHCQWVKKYNAGKFPIRNWASTTLDDFDIPANKTIDSNPSMYGLRSEVFDWANFIYSRKKDCEVETDDPMSQPEHCRDDYVLNPQRKEPYLRRYVLNDQQNEIPHKGTFDWNEIAVDQTNGVITNIQRETFDPHPFVPVERLVKDDLTKNVCFKTLENAKNKVIRFPSDKNIANQYIVNLAARSCPISPYDDRGFPDSADDHYKTSPNYEDGSIHGPPFYEECNPDVGYIRFSRGAGGGNMGKANDKDTFKTGIDDRFFARDIRAIFMAPDGGPSADSGRCNPNRDMTGGLIDMGVWYNTPCSYFIDTWYNEKEVPDPTKPGETIIAKETIWYASWSDMGAVTDKFRNWMRGKLAYKGFERANRAKTEASQYGVHWLEYETPLEPFGASGYPPRESVINKGTATRQPINTPNQTVPSTVSLPLKLDLPMVERIRNTCSAMDFVGVWDGDRGEHLAMWMTGKENGYRGRCDYWSGAYGKYDEAHGWGGKSKSGTLYYGWRLPRFDYEFLAAFKGCTGPFVMPPTPCSVPKFKCVGTCKCSARSREPQCCDADGDGFAETCGCLNKTECKVEPPCTDYTDNMTDSKTGKDTSYCSNLSHKPQIYCVGNEGMHQTWHQGEWADPDAADDCGGKAGENSCNPASVDSVTSSESCEPVYETIRPVNLPKNKFWCNCPDEYAKSPNCSEWLCNCDQNDMPGCMAVYKRTTKNDGPEISSGGVTGVGNLDWPGAKHPFSVWYNCYKYARANACPVLDRDFSTSITPANLVAETSYSSLSGKGVEVGVTGDDFGDCRIRKPWSWPGESFKHCTWIEFPFHGDFFNKFPMRWGAGEPNILAMLPTEADPSAVVSLSSGGTKELKNTDFSFRAQIDAMGGPTIEPVVPYELNAPDQFSQSLMTSPRFENVEKSARLAYNKPTSQGITNIPPSSSGVLPGKPLPQYNSSIVGARGCDIGGWYELMLYQARCIRIFKLNCLCDYDKTFAEGTAEAYVLLRSGLSFETVKPKLDKFGNPTDNVEYVTLIWPRMWRGYASPLYAKDCGNPMARLWTAHTRAGVDYPGLDCAKAGDFMILDEQLRTQAGTGEWTDARYRRHIAYVESTGWANPEAPSDLEGQEIPCAVPTGDRSRHYIIVSEWNWGKNQDACGITNRWKQTTRRTIVKYPDQSFATVDNRNEVRKLAAGGNCADPYEYYKNPACLEFAPPYGPCKDPDFKQCYEQNWRQIKLYRPSWDVRTADRPWKSSKPEDAQQPIDAFASPTAIKKVFPLIQPAPDASARNNAPPTCGGVGVIGGSIDPNFDCTRFIQNCDGAGFKPMTKEQINLCIPQSGGVPLSGGGTSPVTGGCEVEGMPVCSLPPDFITPEWLADNGTYTRPNPSNPTENIPIPYYKGGKCDLEAGGGVRDTHRYLCAYDKVKERYDYKKTLAALKDRIGLCDPPHTSFINTLDGVGANDKAKASQYVPQPTQNTTLTPPAGFEGAFGAKGRVIIRDGRGNIIMNGSKPAEADKSDYPSDSGIDNWPGRIGDLPDGVKPAPATP